MSGYNISLPALSGNHRFQSTTEGGPVPGGGNVRFTAELLSAIRNLVCPECGGPMGGPSKEFKCRGKCGKDWRPEWERLRARRVYTAGPKLSAEIAPVGGTQIRDTSFTRADVVEIEPRGISPVSCQSSITL
jgi:hypothetical protein